MVLPAVPVSQSPESKFREYLATRPKSQRLTRPQRELIQFIFAQHDHFDVNQLIRELDRAELQISRPTVYRTLAKLVDAGLLRRIEVGSRTLYEHDYGYPQHEHMICEVCKRMIEFQSEAIQNALRDVCAHHQFHPSGHTLIVRGVCVDCNRARSAKRRLDLI